jgi:hypothetical protein
MEYFLFFFISIVLFIVGREFVLWYFKINDKIKKLDSINTSLDEIRALLKNETDKN